jgi:hypothetical protein
VLFLLNLKIDRCVIPFNQEIDVYSFNPEIEDVFLLEMDILFGILE